MSAEYLKVKIKSLAAEARIIRSKEHQLTEAGEGPSKVREGLHNHRINEVRTEARSTLLAYGYLRGRSYRCIEGSCHSKPNWERVGKMIKKYGEGEFDKAALEAWAANPVAVRRLAPVVASAAL